MYGSVLFVFRIKSHIRVLVQRISVNHFEFPALLTEGESIMNSCSLTPVSDDRSDLEALTPSHFLLGRKVTGLPPGLFAKGNSLRRTQWHKIQYFADASWKCWDTEYILTQLSHARNPTVIQRQDWRPRAHRRQQPAPGKLSFWKSECNIPRPRWL